MEQLSSRKFTLRRKLWLAAAVLAAWPIYALADQYFDNVYADSFNGPLTGNVVGNVTGNLTGNVNGNVTGNLTGNVTGNVTGTATNVSGVVAIANGGTGQTGATAAFNALSPLTTLGDLLYGGTSGSGTRLAGNTTTTKNLLTQTGNGSASAAPVWESLSTILDSISSTQGSILYRNSSGWTSLGPGTSGQCLQTQGAGANPQWAACGSVAVKGYAWVDTGNGLGSTNTFIRRFANIRAESGTVDYADSSTAGGSFTSTDTQICSVHYCDSGTAAKNFGLSLNGTTLNSGINGQTYAAGFRGSVTSAGNGSLICIDVTLPLSTNDVIRAHTADTAGLNSDSNTVFSMTCW